MTAITAIWWFLRKRARGRTTQRYHRRKELLDDRPGYDPGRDLAGALEHGTA
ncbi:hypothetical protein ACWC2T_43765 [Streptomyces sp. NPDC001393]